MVSGELGPRGGKVRERKLTLSRDRDGDFGATGGGGRGEVPGDGRWRDDDGRLYAGPQMAESMGGHGVVDVCVCVGVWSEAEDDG